MQSSTRRHTQTHARTHARTHAHLKAIWYQPDWNHFRIRDVENLKQELARLNQRKQPEAATLQDLQEVWLLYTVFPSSSDVYQNKWGLEHLCINLKQGSMTTLQFVFLSSSGVYWRRWGLEHLCVIKKIVNNNGVWPHYSLSFSLVVV